MAREFDPLFGMPPCRYAQMDCLPGCEYGYAGPCERNKVSHDEERWLDITHVGSVHEIQWNPVTSAHRHRPLSLGPNGKPDRRWVDREWIAGRPPGDMEVCNDNIDQRLEISMLTLERTIQEVSVTVSDFKRSMGKLLRAIQFLFWAFVVLGLCLLALAWISLP